MHPVQLGELPRKGKRLVPRGDVDKRVAAHDFLRFSEGSIGRVQLAAARPDASAFRTRGGFTSRELPIRRI